jgi:hypothetical protein
MVLFVSLSSTKNIISFLGKAEKKSMKKKINVKIIKNFGGGIYVPYYFCIDDKHIDIFKNNFLLTEIKNTNNLFICDFDLVNIV